MQKKLPRKKLAEIIAAYDGGELAPRTAAARQDAVSEGLAVLCRAEESIPAGAPITVVGFAGSPTAAQAYENMTNRRAVLCVEANCSSQTTDGTAIDAIPLGKIGRCVLKNAFFHQIVVRDESHQYVTGAWETTADSAQAAFAIAAVSEIGEHGAAFAVLSFLGVSGNRTAVVKSFTATPALKSVLVKKENKSVTYATGLGLDQNGYLTLETTTMNYIESEEENIGFVANIANLQTATVLTP